MFRIVVKEHLDKKKYFSLAYHNKIFQKKLEISLEDYREYHKRLLYRVEMELIPINNIKPGINHHFIRRRENHFYYHIYRIYLYFKLNNFYKF